MSLVESHRFTRRHSVAGSGRFVTNLHKSSLKSGEHFPLDAARRNTSAVRSGARERNGFNKANLVPTSRRTGFDANTHTRTAEAHTAISSAARRLGVYVRSLMFIIIQCRLSYWRSSLVPPNPQHSHPRVSSDSFPGD